MLNGRCKHAEWAIQACILPACSLRPALSTAARAVDMSPAGASNAGVHPRALAEALNGALEQRPREPVRRAPHSRSASAQQSPANRRLPPAGCTTSPGEPSPGRALREASRADGVPGPAVPPGLVVQPARVNPSTATGPALARRPPMSAACLPSESGKTQICVTVHATDSAGRSEWSGMFHPAVHGGTARLYKLRVGRAGHRVSDCWAPTGRPGPKRRKATVTARGSRRLVRAAETAGWKRRPTYFK